MPAMDDEDRKHVEEMLRVLRETEAWAARTSADASRRRPAGQLDNGPDHFPRADGSEEPLSPGLNHAWAPVRCPRYRYHGGWD